MKITVDVSVSNSGTVSLKLGTSGKTMYITCSKGVACKLLLGLAETEEIVQC